MEEIISSMSNLIYHIARELTSNPDLINELYNQGILGIYDAYSHYNENSNTKFSSYAYMYIYGKMYSYINYTNSSVKLTKDNIKLYKLILKAKDYLSQLNSKEPSTKEISLYLKIDESLISNILNMNLKPLSLDFEYDDNSSLSSLIKSDDFINSIEIKDLLDSLDDNQRKVIVYKYYSGYSQSEIANIMNMSQSSVSRCEKESIELMRVRSR